MLMPCSPLLVSNRWRGLHRGTVNQIISEILYKLICDTYNCNFDYKGLVMRSLCRISLLIVLLAHSVVRAETFTYNFTGHITALTLFDDFGRYDEVAQSDLTGVTLKLGDKYTGSFTYDADAPMTGHSTSSNYHAGAVKAFSLNFLDSGLSYHVATGNVTVHASEYLYYVSIHNLSPNSPYWLASFNFYDLSAGHELSRNIPRDLGSFFDSANFTFGSDLSFGGPDGVSLSIGNSVDGISAVDEPGITVMMIAGLGLLGLIPRRRRQRADVGVLLSA